MNKKEMVKVLAKIARENNYVKSDMLNAVYNGLTIEESAFIASAIEYMFDPKAHSYKFDGKEYVDVTPIAAVGIVNSLFDHKKMLYKQVTSIERWDENKEYFDNLYYDIPLGSFRSVINELLTLPTSNIDPYPYQMVIDGKANNSGEDVVYNNYTYILTASSTSITLFKRVV